MVRVSTIFIPTRGSLELLPYSINQIILGHLIIWFVHSFSSGSYPSEQVRHILQHPHRQLLSNRYQWLEPRDHDLGEHSPVSHGNLFKSIFNLTSHLKLDLKNSVEEAHVWRMCSLNHCLLLEHYDKRMIRIPSF